MTNWAQMFTGLLFYVYVGKYTTENTGLSQRCPVPLKCYIVGVWVRAQFWFMVVDGVKGYIPTELFN